MKKWTIVLIVLLAAFCACTGVWAETPVGQFEYSIAGGEVTITKYTGSDADVVVPATIDGLPVTAIGEYSFYWNTTLSTITLPLTVRSVDRYAFMYCENLKAVYGANNVTGYGNRAFGQCTSLAHIDINKNLQRLEYGAFEECPLPYITLCLPESTDDNVEYMYGDAITILYFAVKGNEAVLTKAEAGGDSLRDVQVPSSFEGKPVTTIDKGAFSSQQWLKTIQLPDTIHTIGVDAFASCENLNSIVLPEGLQSLGENAFMYSGITSINIPPKITELPPYCLYGTRIECFEIPAHVTSIGQCALAYTKLKSIVVPETVTEFGAYLFSGCSELTDVTLPNNMTYLPMCAFAWCTSLESIVLPDSITAFSTASFSGCTSLKEINLPANLQSVTSCAFGDSAIETKSVARIVSQVIKPGMSDFEKALALHDWIIYNADYDTECSFFSAAGVLFFGRGVCQSYADAYALLLSAVGIPHNQVSSASMDHTWNLVMLDGEWYHVDCTWDDPTGGGKEQHQFFGIDDELMRQTHKWDLPEFYAPATGTRYRYGVDNKPAATPTPTAKPPVVPIVTPTPEPDPVRPDSSAADFDYTVANDEVTITKYKGSDAFVVVPATIEGLPVTVIGELAFYYDTNIETVSLPTSVHTIQYLAFGGCTGLTTVYGTQNVVFYGQSAFDGCTRLSDININTYKDHLDIGISCFRDCALSPIVLGIPASSAMIDEQRTYAYGEDITMCFFDVKNGEAVLVEAHHGSGRTGWHLEIPSTYRGMPVTAIAADAVSDDWTIASVTLPGTIKEIGENAFNNCAELNAKIYAGDVIVWRGAFGNCPGVTITQQKSPAADFTYIVRNGEVTITSYIGDDEHVVIPDTIAGMPVTAIGDFAFAGYPNLNSITLSQLAVIFRDSTVRRSTGVLRLTIPASVTDIGNNAFEDCASLVSVELPKGLESIGDNAFSGIPNIDVVLPTNIQHIGKSAFDGNPQTLPERDCLTAFALAEGQSGSVYKVVGQEQFLIRAGTDGQGAKMFCLVDTTAKGNVKIPAGITEISESVQQRVNDGSIKSMSIPDSVQKIELKVDAGNQEFTVQCNPGSAASSWATQNGVSWDAKQRIAGDADDDGYVGIDDALAILQYADGWDLVIQLNACDVNADGDVDIYDALLIMQYVAGWNVALK